MKDLPKRSPRASAAAAHAECERRYMALARMCNEPVLIECAGAVVFANRAAGELFSGQESAELVGRKLMDVIPSAATAPIAACVAAGAGEFRPHVATHVDGARISVEVAFDTCSFEHRDAFQMVVRTVRPDPRDVRGVFPERLAFREMVAEAIAAADRAGHFLAVMILGIDNFPAVAASEGAEAADSAFREATRRMIEGVRLADTIASVGLHEFAILVDGLGDPAMLAILAQRKLESISRPLAHAKGPVAMTASVGVAILSSDVHDADALIASANRAFIAARHAGGNGFRIHSRDSDDEAQRRGAPLAETAKRLARLTPREAQVLDMLVLGKASKMIAFVLGTSARTVEGHRARVMQKMHADSLASLVAMTLQGRA